MYIHISHIHVMYFQIGYPVPGKNPLFLRDLRTTPSSEFDVSDISRNNPDQSPAQPSSSKTKFTTHEPTLRFTQFRLNASSCSWNIRKITAFMNQSPAKPENPRTWTRNTPPYLSGFFSPVPKPMPYFLDVRGLCFLGEPNQSSGLCSWKNCLDLVT